MGRKTYESIGKPLPGRTNVIITHNKNLNAIGCVIVSSLDEALEISKGDTIVTSSYSSIFPEGIMVGTIEDFEKIAGNTFYNVTIKLSTDFNRLSYVNVVNNLMREEQTTLEKSSQHD